jgi:NAD(P)-dependent dehydrogenase (short-subunit alcohol dehydrogenase family)
MRLEQASTPPVALVTGASSGIGLAAARELATRGVTVVCASRAEGAGAEVAERLAHQTGGDVRFMPVDLSRPRDAVALAQAFEERLGRLDVLVNNAGAFVHRHARTEDGFERTFALNHLGPFALTLPLLRLLGETGGRVITVSSNAALGARLQLDDPHSERRFSGWGAYAWSKLCNQLFTLALARRVDAAAVRVYAMHPGFVATAFGHVDGPMGTAVRGAQRLFGRTPERGADTVVWLATEGAPPAEHGAYVVDRRVRAPAPKARDEAAQDRLWAISEAALEQVGVRVDAAPVAVAARRPARG